jgi:hypothetical protein
MSVHVRTIPLGFWMTKLAGEDSGAAVAGRAVLPCGVHGCGFAMR